MAFVKGQSGNPSGRPKAIKAVEDLARENTALAIKTLVEVCGSAEAPAAARVSAAVAVLDRGWGKPRQENLHRHTGSISSMTDDQLMAIVASSSEGEAIH